MTQSLDKQMDRIVVPGLNITRHVYVLKKIEDEPGQQTFVTGVDSTGVTASNKLKNAMQFPSRLAARGFTMNQHKGLFAAGDWEYVKIELVPEPEPFVPPCDLLVEDPMEAIKRICELHAMYSDRIADWVRVATNLIADYSPPKIVITVRPQKWAGLYSPSDHTVHYCLAYAMMHLGDRPKTLWDFEHTVAHEVVHAYQQKFTSHKPGHGGDFYAMMRHAALYPVNAHTHNYMVGKCVKVSKQLQKPFEKMAEGGLLAGLPCEVVTVAIQRRGIGCL